MATTGTVTIKGRFASDTDILYGANAYTLPVTQNGSFPENYKVLSASVQYHVRLVYAQHDRHMLITGSNGSLLGDVPTIKGGILTGSLSTSASYDGITSLTLDGGQKNAVRLRGGSYLIITVEWEETEPEEEEPPEQEENPEELDVKTGTIRLDGNPDTAMHTECLVQFEGVDISKDIKKYLISLSYTDNEEDETDDLQIRLQDADGDWLQKWLDASLQAAISSGSISLGGKTKGMKIKAAIKAYYPNGFIRQSDCGELTLDNLKASGPPSTITLKASSLPYASGVRTEERDKAWEKYNLSGILREIAGKASLGYLFDANGDPYYARREQVKQTDIAFLQSLCHDAGYALKVCDSRLVVFDQAKYEALAPMCTISWMDGSYTKYDLSTAEGDVTYAKCTVKYYDPDTKETIIGSATAETFDAEDENNQTLIISDHKVTTVSEAEALAAKLLKLHNKFEREASFTMVGNPLLAAGLTVTISGFGLWDGKYLIKQSKHDIGANGYTTKIKLRAVYAHSSEKTAKEEQKPSSGSNTSQTTKKSNKYHWETTCTAILFDRPYETGNAGKQVGRVSKGTTVTLLGTTAQGYTLISAGGAQGYVPTSCLSKVYE